MENHNGNKYKLSFIIKRDTKKMERKKLSRICSISWNISESKRDVP